MKLKPNRHKAVKNVLFIVGFLLCSYPVVSSMIQRQYQRDAVATYKSEVHASEQIDIDRIRKEAQEYNATLYASQGILLANDKANLLDHDYYDQLLNVNGDGIMAVIEIPSIDVLFPVYHGTDEEVLSVAAGHVEGTSLPVGGINTRAVLTAHRGLPNAKLFTRLDELETGDDFYIQVLGETLAYEVVEIEVIDPKDVENIQIAEGKDLVSLLTCTPYGVNTHRLVVTGERKVYEEEEYSQNKGHIMSFREICFLCIPVLFLGIRFVAVMRKRKKEADLSE